MKKQKLGCEWAFKTKNWLIFILKAFIKQPVIKQSPTFLSFSYLIECCVSVFSLSLSKRLQILGKLIKFHWQAKNFGFKCYFGLSRPSGTKNVVDIERHLFSKSLDPPLGLSVLTYLLPIFHSWKNTVIDLHQHIVQKTSMKKWHLKERCYSLHLKSKPHCSASVFYITC